MALGKSLNTNYGVNAKYWKITAIHLACNFNKCQIGVSGYLDEESRNEDKNPICTEMYTIKDDNFLKYINISELNKEGNNIIEACYRYLKENINEFIDSENI